MVSHIVALSGSLNNARVRSKLLRLTVACATFVAGVLVGSFYHSAEVLASAPAATQVPAPQSTPAYSKEETYPDNLGIEPFDIESFIDNHPQADLSRLWQRLGVTGEGDPIAEFSFGNACSSCDANSFHYNLDDDFGGETVLQIKQQLGESYRYLIFKNIAYGDSKLLGHVDVWAKYPPHDPVVFVSKGKAWLILQSTAATGSGVGAWLDTVYEVSNRGVRKVGSYLGEVSQSGDSTFPTRFVDGRPLSCEIRNGRAILTLSFTVEYFAHNLPLFSTRKTAVLVDSEIDAAKSEITPHEYETIYNFDSMGPEEFSRYNRAELRAIARGTDLEKKRWLHEFLLSHRNRQRQ